MGEAYIIFQACLKILLYDKTINDSL